MGTALCRIAMLRRQIAETRLSAAEEYDLSSSSGTDEALGIDVGYISDSSRTWVTCLRKELDDYCRRLGLEPSS